MVTASAIDFTTERVRFNEIAVPAQIGDTLKATLQILSSDSTQQAYSRYAYVELVNGSDSILIRKKYRCDDAGRFYAAIPTNDLLHGSVYYLRSYTRFMMNYSSQSYAYAPVVIGADAAGYAPPAPLEPTDTPVGIMAIRHGQRINMQVMGTADEELATWKLYVFHDDIGLQTIPMTTEGAAAMDIDGLGEQSLLSFFLTDSRHHILAQQHICLSDQIPAASPVWESDLTTPVAYSYAHLNTQEALDEWLSHCTFCRFDLTSVLEGRFSFSYPCERALTISGRLLTVKGAPAKKGFVSAFCQQNYTSGEGEVDEDGRFVIELPDFENGSTFFVSARSKHTARSKSEYIYELDGEGNDNVVIPTSARLIPVTRTAVMEQTLATSSLSDGIQLSEAKIKTIRKSSMMANRDKIVGNYIRVRDNAALYPSMTSVIEKMYRIEIVDAIQMDGSTIPIIMNRRGRSLMGRPEAEAVTIMLDGTYVDAEELLNIDPCMIEDVEYFSPTEAKKATHFCFNGLLVVRTIQPAAVVNKEKSANGVWHQPLGLN